MKIKHQIVGEGSLTSLCRKMIADGADPETEIEFYRGKTLCFNAPTTLCGWAYWTVDTNLKLKKHVPFVPFD